MKKNFSLSEAEYRIIKNINLYESNKFIIRFIHKHCLFAESDSYCYRNVVVFENVGIDFFFNSFLPIIHAWEESDWSSSEVLSQWAPKEIFFCSTWERVENMLQTDSTAGWQIEKNAFLTVSREYILQWNVFSEKWAVVSNTSFVNLFFLTDKQT